MIYLIAFLANTWVSKTVDAPAAAAGLTDPLSAVLVDAALLLAFIVPHSVMARPWFKRWLLGFWPAELERSLYVLVSSLLIVLLIWQWRPLTDPVWQLEPGSVWWWALRGLSLTGWGLALLASHSLGHTSTFGLKPVLDKARGQTPQRRQLRTTGLYGVLRHPMYVGFLIGLWATPRMSQGYLLIALLLSAYVFVGRLFEERDLRSNYGEAWHTWARRVPAFFPRLRRNPAVDV